MKQLIIDSQNPNGKILETDEIVAEQNFEKEEPIKAFFEGLASADTNSIAKIRELAKTFLANTEEV